MKLFSRPDEPHGSWWRILAAFRGSSPTDQAESPPPTTPADGNGAGPSPVTEPANGESSVPARPLDSPDLPEQSVPLNPEPPDEAGGEDSPGEGAGSDTAPETTRTVSPSPRTISILGVSLFCFSVIWLSVELASISGVRSGILAALSFGFIVAAAPFIHYRRIKPVRHLVVPLAAASGTLTIARWPVPFADNPAAALSIQVLSILGLAWILAKILLLQRFSTMYCSRVEFADDELTRLLPLQEEYLERLKKAIFSGHSLQGSRVVQLVGNWGQGKSFLIDRLGFFLQDEECAVVVINVWEQQSEPDLHLAIVEQVLSHHKYWYPYGWLYYSFNLFLARAAKEWRFALSAGKEATKAEVQIPLSLPRPTGRRYLEQQVDRVRKKGTRTVIVLDEIDRAAPRVAQSAMTFARRSLDMASVVVVLSYVDPIIRYKAFNPLLKTLPDLASTMQAVIFDRGPDKGVDNPVPMPGGPLTAPSSASLREWEAWQKAEEALLSTSTASSPGAAPSLGGGVNSDPQEGDDCRLAQTLHLAFANASVGERRRLQGKFSERYLGTDPIQMRPLQIGDVAEVVLCFDTIKKRVLELLGCADGRLADGARNDLVSKITSALGFVFPAHDEPPTLRTLEGELLRRFTGINPKEIPAHFSNEFIAAVVVTAYDAAARNMR